MRHLITLLAALALFALTHKAYAQYTIYDQLADKNRGRGTIQLQEPSGLKETIFHASANAPEGLSDGYRVRIYRGLGRNARTESQNMQNDVENRFPGLPVYTAYVAPYYTVAVGDCRTRLEALHLQRQIVGRFPQAFVVQERVNYPPRTPWRMKP